MENLIHILPDSVANQIAAGEVVNRPASAVKELLENAIDAGATEIELHVQDAGRSLIQVVDNGCGMSEKDAQACFLPHATSKLSSAQDLLQIRTLGFRGEALASIAAVAQVELQTRRKGDEIGTSVRIEGNRLGPVEACSCPEGTCIKVKNLYFNTPARRQFLKSNEVENRYIEDEFNRVALAQPQIRFSLYRNGQRISMLDAGNLKRRIVQLMGKAFESRIVKVSETIPSLSLSGYLCSPDYSVKGRSKQFFFVNRRFIRHPGLSNAVEKAYQDLLPEGKSPAFFLYIETDPATIDVNIHPTKTEIRFKDEHLLYGVVLSACKHALGINQMRNVLDFESSQALPYRYQPKTQMPGIPKPRLHAGYDPFTNPNPGENASFSGISPAFPHGNAGNASGTDAAYREAYRENFALMQQGAGDAAPNQLVLDCYEEILSDTRLDPLFPLPAEETAQAREPGSRLPSGEPEKEKGGSGSRIFQIFDRYIVAPLKSGLAILHQEAASERVIYNDLVQKTGTARLSQRTLFPQTIELSASHAELLRDVREMLNHLGWSIEWLGQNTFMVNAFPAGIQESLVQESMENLLDDYAANLLKGKNTGSAASLPAAMARQLAVKQGTPLCQEEILYLANRLFSGPEPEISPSGKRILWIISEKDLASLFNDPFPWTEKPLAGKPATERPVIEKPLANKPAIDEFSTQDPSATSP